MNNEQRTTSNEKATTSQHVRDGRIAVLFDATRSVDFSNYNPLADSGVVLQNRVRSDQTNDPISNELTQTEKERPIRALIGSECSSNYGILPVTAAWQLGDLQAEGGGRLAVRSHREERAENNNGRRSGGTEEQRRKVAKQKPCTLENCKLLADCSR